MSEEQQPQTPLADLTADQRRSWAFRLIASMITTRPMDVFGTSDTEMTVADEAAILAIIGETRTAFLGAAKILTPEDGALIDELAAELARMGYAR